MKRDLLAYLACPRCGGELRFSQLEKFPRTETSDVEEGALSCAGCHGDYELSGGVPRLAVGASRDRRAAKTHEALAFKWKRHPGSLPEDERQLLDESQIAPGFFRGKLVLDADCGMGRYAVVALSLGAEVVAMDVSESLGRLAEMAPRWPKLHVVEGDVSAPPLKAGRFDIVYSLGALHHARDARHAFGRVAALVKPGGFLTLWLYGKAGRYGDFATNPVLKSHAWAAKHRRMAWLAVGARQIYGDVIRFFTTRLPVPLSFALSYPLALLGAVPLLKALTFSSHKRFMGRVVENFGWISTPYQWRHTKEELARWFEEEGFEVLRLMPHGLMPRAGMVGRKGAASRKQP